MKCLLIENIRQLNRESSRSAIIAHLKWFSNSNSGTPTVRTVILTQKTMHVIFISFRNNITTNGRLNTGAMPAILFHCRQNERIIAHFLTRGFYIQT